MFYKKKKANISAASERADKGFSLMEILIALVLVVGVFATVFTNVMQNRDKGQVSQAKIYHQPLGGRDEHFLHGLQLLPLHSRRFRSLGDSSAKM